MFEVNFVLLSLLDGLFTSFKKAGELRELLGVNGLFYPWNIGRKRGLTMGFNRLFSVNDMVSLSLT